MLPKKPFSFKKTMLKVLYTIVEILTSIPVQKYDERFEIGYKLDETGFYQSSLKHGMPHTVVFKR